MSKLRPFDNTEYETMRLPNETYTCIVSKPQRHINNLNKMKAYLKRKNISFVIGRSKDKQFQIFRKIYATEIDNNENDTEKERKRKTDFIHYLENKRQKPKKYDVIYEFPE